MLRGVNPRTGFLFAVVRDIQRNCGLRLGAHAGPVSIRCRARCIAQHPDTKTRPAVTWIQFAVVRDAQRNRDHPVHDGGRSAVSIRCRARRTAQRGHPEPAREGQGVSICCRTRRTAQRSAPCRTPATPSGFYSLSCETYSATAAQPQGPPLDRFYSLSCETYSATVAFAALVAVALRQFLFAVVRDVQRTTTTTPTTSPPSSFYSLSCETYSATRRIRSSRPSWTGAFLFAVVRDVQRNATQPEPKVTYTFLFAVVRDVQRNGRRLPEHRRQPGFYSLSCETCSATLTCVPGANNDTDVSIRCRARRTTQRSLAYLRARQGVRRCVSLQCRAGRTAQLSRCPRAPPSPSFYSLSCETYSATCTNCWLIHPEGACGFYSLSCET